MPRYIVFAGAPTAAELKRAPVDQSYQWRTVTSATATDAQSTKSGSEQVAAPQDLLPKLTLDAASRRISNLYQNVLFDRTTAGDDYVEEESAEENDQHDGTTMYSWPPTESRRVDEATHETTFLRPSGSLPDVTRQTLNTQSFSYSEAYSDASSIGRFPSFTFNPNALTLLAALVSTSPRKVNVLAAVVEVEGPDTIRIKNGRDAGKEVSLLKLVLGDDSDGGVARLTAWRDVADTWGGNDPAAPALKKGDVVYFEGVNYTPDAASSSPMLTASPFLRSAMQICFRTLPYAHEDGRLRPDLRLGASDAAVRRVAALVRWLEQVAGLG